LLPKLFKKFELNNGERIIVMALFFFSTWSLLLSTTIMQDIILTFFVIALFLAIEEYFEKRDKKSLAIVVLFTVLMCFTKFSSYILLAGFGLYILIKKKEKFLKKKFNLISSIFVGVLITSFWPIKNYFTFGNPFVATKLNKIVLHSFSEYSTFFVQTYHYFWEFPLREKVNLAGTLGNLFNLFYIGALTISILFSILLIISFISYCKKKKEFIGLFFPILLFALIYWPFIILWSASDSGRYTFPFWIFFFVFVAKYISGIKKRWLKRACQIVIVLFCIVSVISAFGISIHMNSLDSQIRDISKKLKQENLENVTIISNTEFGATSLRYYLGKPVIFNMSRNVIDPNVKCSGENIFSSKNFEVFRENNEYRLCRK